MSIILWILHPQEALILEPHVPRGHVPNEQGELVINAIPTVQTPVIGVRKWSKFLVESNVAGIESVPPSDKVLRCHSAWGGGAADAGSLATREGKLSTEIQGSETIWSGWRRKSLQCNKRTSPSHDLPDYIFGDKLRVV